MGGVAANPSSDPAEPHTLQASTPLLSALGSPVPQGWSPQRTLASDPVEQSLCMWHRPLPRLAPLVSSGQGAGRQGWLGRGWRPGAQRHWPRGSPRGGEGQLWTEGRGDCCNWSPSSLQALDSGMEGPWDQSCPAGGGRAGQPLPQSRLPPGSHCPCRAAGALHPAQPVTVGFCSPPRGASSPVPSHRHNPMAGLRVKSTCFLLERGILSTKVPGGRGRLGLLW